MGVSGKDRLEGLFIAERSIDMKTARSVGSLYLGLLGLLMLAMSLVVSVPRARAEPETQSDLTDIITGAKKGRVIVSPTASGQGTFVAQVTVNVHDLAPNTTYQVWRAVNSLPFGQVASITTSAGGAGAAHFVRSAALVSGDQFSLQLQVRLNDGVTVVLQSAVMTITVK
jgi:hypothetical protein